MILDDITSFWWENITGPQMLVEEISTCLLDGCNVVLQNDGGLPWREHMRDFVARRLGQVRLRTLNWDGAEAQRQIVPMLLNRLYRNGLSVCPIDYKSQLIYLKNETVFADTVVWIVPADSGDQTSLLRFLSDYRGKGLNCHGAFVLEVSEEQKLPQMSSQNVVLRCSDYIRYNDLLLYANILADGTCEKQELKSYMACVATSLADRDAELIPEIIQGIDFERENPGEALVHMWDENCTHCPNNRPDRQELQMRVWKAQLQTAFALIEMERLRITEEYWDIIEQALSTEYWEPRRNRTGFIHQRGDEPECPSDVELGTLVRMMSLRCNDDRTIPLLFFQDKELRNRIIFLTECRNNLAHHKVCTPGQMYELFCFSNYR